MKKIILLWMLILLLGCIQPKNDQDSSSNTTINDLNDKTWFSVEPIQCGMNPWERNEKGKEGYQGTVEEWLEKEHKIEVYEVKSERIYELVCEACNCPRGDLLSVLVDSKNQDKMLELGFKMVDK